MIVAFWDKNDYSYTSDRFQTNGCSCCSVELDADIDKERIIEHAKGNMKMARFIESYYGISLEEYDPWG